MTKLGLVLLSSVTLAACAADPTPTPDPTPDIKSKQQFVMSEMSIVGEPGLDLDDDSRHRIDNKMAAVLSMVDRAFGSPTAQERVDAEMASGALALDVELGWNGGSAEDDVVIAVDLPGAAAGAPGSTVGRMVGRRFTTELPGAAPIRLALLPGFEPVAVRLYGVKIEATLGDDGILRGTLGGAISKSELDDHVIPAIHPLVVRFVAAHPAASETEKLLQLFDPNKDRTITREEFQSSPLIQALLSPDIDLVENATLPSLAYAKDGQNDGLSVGFTFEAGPN